MTTTASDKRDGISWGDDRLFSVASRAATELDFIRLGRPKGADHLTALSRWLIQYADGAAPFDIFAAALLSRVMDRLGRPGAQTMDDIRPFARNIGLALGEAAEGGSVRHADLIPICLAISKLGCYDRFYGRQRAVPGQWRGVNWWVPADPAPPASGDPPRE